ncbi:MAG: FtsW/RodA/SpoVE family cell cycle protein [Planctomycetaceae bacterium]
MPVCALGLMLMGLTGIVRGDELAGAGDYFGRQIVWIALSVPAMLAATLFPYRRLRRFTWAAFAVCLVLLVVVFFLPPRNSSHRWIPLGLFYFQPSEATKLAYILTLAQYLMHRQNYRRLPGLLVPFLLTLVPVGLVLREPDLGTSLLFFPVLFAMLFAAGARPRHLASIAFLGVLCLPLLWMGMSTEQRSRVTAVFSQRDGGPPPRGDGYHLHQSKRVLTLGGVWGSEATGMPLDDPRGYHLPASRTDFIFCLVGERWGLIGCVATLGLYVVLFTQGLRIAAATREPFGRLLAVGIIALLAAQTVINAGMTVGLMPVTGMTLPLMSYGGSSLLATCVSLGLVMNVGMRPGYEITPEPFRFSAE